MSCPVNCCHQMLPLKSRLCPSLCKAVSPVERLCAKRPILVPLHRVLIPVFLGPDRANRSLGGSPLVSKTMQRGVSPLARLILLVLLPIPSCVAPCHIVPFGSTDFALTVLHNVKISLC